MCDIDVTLQEYMALKRSINGLESKLKDLEDTIKAHMGDEEVLEAGGYTVRWKHYTQSRFDTAAFRQAHEVIYQQYQTEVPARRFTVT